MAARHCLVYAVTGDAASTHIVAAGENGVMSTDTGMSLGSFTRVCGSTAAFDSPGSPADVSGQGIDSSVGLVVVSGPEGMNPLAAAMLGKAIHGRVEVDEHDGSYSGLVNVDVKMLCGGRAVVDGLLVETEEDFKTVVASGYAKVHASTDLLHHLCIDGRRVLTFATVHSNSQFDGFVLNGLIEEHSNDGNTVIIAVADEDHHRSLRRLALVQQYNGAPLDKLPKPALMPNVAFARQAPQAPAILPGLVAKVPMAAAAPAVIAPGQALAAPAVKDVTVDAKAQEPVAGGAGAVMVAGSGIIPIALAAAPFEASSAGAGALAVPKAVVPPSALAAAAADKGAAAEAAPQSQQSKASGAAAGGAGSAGAVEPAREHDENELKGGLGIPSAVSKALPAAPPKGMSDAHALVPAGRVQLPPGCISLQGQLSIAVTLGDFPAELIKPTPTLSDEKYAVAVYKAPYEALYKGWVAYGRLSTPVTLLERRAQMLDLISDASITAAIVEVASADAARGLPAELMAKRMPLLLKEGTKVVLRIEGPFGSSSAEITSVQQIPEFFEQMETSLGKAIAADRAAAQAAKEVEAATAAIKQARSKATDATAIAAKKASSKCSVKQVAAAHAAASKAEADVVAAEEAEEGARAAATAATEASEAFRDDEYRVFVECNNVLAFAVAFVTSKCPFGRELHACLGELGVAYKAGSIDARIFNKHPILKAMQPAIARGGLAYYAVGSADVQRSLDLFRVVQDLAKGRIAPLQLRKPVEDAPHLGRPTAPSRAGIRALKLKLYAAGVGASAGAGGRALSELRGRAADQEGEDAYAKAGGRELTPSPTRNRAVLEATTGVNRR